MKEKRERIRCLSDDMIPTLEQTIEQWVEMGSICLWWNGYCLIITGDQNKKGADIHLP